LLLACLLFSLGCTAPAPSPRTSTGSNNPAIPPLPAEEIKYADGATQAEIVVAGGCFWCTEAVFEEVYGVTDVVSGYAGGSKAAANYDDVARGHTAHAEAIRISFNPQQVSSGEILQIFFTMHDPTQVNAQYPDIGTQYRSAVFYKQPREKEVAAAYIKQLDASGFFKEPVATTVEPLTEFYPAEDYHQDYVKRNPYDPYVQQWADDKIAKVRKLFKIKE